MAWLPLKIQMRNWKTLPFKDVAISRSLRGMFGSAPLEAIILLFAECIWRFELYGDIFKRLLHHMQEFYHIRQVVWHRGINYREGWRRLHCSVVWSNTLTQMWMWMTPVKHEPERNIQSRSGLSFNLDTFGSPYCSAFHSLPRFVLVANRINANSAIPNS